MVFHSYSALTNIQLAMYKKIYKKMRMHVSTLYTDQIAKSRISNQNSKHFIRLNNRICKYVPK